jgi:two-component system, OmpR family, sensor histidine kinase KdpD
VRREQEAADRLRNLDEMKNAFLQAVSHELRTPLTSILGFALTLEQQEGSLSDEQRRDLVAPLAANARKLKRLLADLLDVDRLARGLLEPRLAQVDLAALVRSVVEETDTQGHAVEIDAEPVVALVEAPKVERILENLLANAVRHTPDRTRIWVRLADLGDEILIEVEDDGPGIPSELKMELFQAFRQGDDQDPHSPGTGIGLALVAGFTKLHGGRVEVADRASGGVSFKVFLPKDVGASTRAHSHSMVPGGLEVTS